MFLGQDYTELARPPLDTLDLPLPRGSRGPVSLSALVFILQLLP